ncbi:hypothetical protein SAMD00019534_097990, partial [Acytostelium subglobosum LB1]|uniref:hypothetical protein n=1 Tax=Acytostelium subglobosum LB1 TaxID=1410327 RepID=UPI000644FB3B
MIGVILPVYISSDGDDGVCSRQLLHFKQAVDSILNQSYTNWSLLIVDDGSHNDQLTQSIQSYVESDQQQRCSYIVNQSNIGIVESLNRGITHLLQQSPLIKYIARMDSDDIAEIERFERQQQHMEINQHIDVLGTPVTMFSDDCHDNTRDNTRVVAHPSGRDIVSWSMFLNCCLVHPSVMVRRRVFERYQYSNKYAHCEDYALWLRLLSKGYHLDNMPVGTPPLLRLRKHPASISKRNASIQRASAANASLHYLQKLSSRNNHDIIKESTNSRMGELMALFLSKCPGAPNTSTLWSKWLKRNPTAQIFSLLSLSNQGSPTFPLIPNSSTQSSMTKIKPSELNIGVKIICFSKDRAFQLGEYLRTFYKYNQDDQTTFPLQMTILYTYSKETYGQSYAELFTAYPQVHFIKETDFTTQLRELVDRPKYRYTVFGVDDILYYNNFTLQTYCERLDRHPDAIGYFIKLNKSIKYCHTANEPIDVPTSLKQLEDSKGTYIQWDRLDGSKRDWNYPWDMCSTVYRSETVKHIIDAIIKYLGIKTGISHPNRLEANGNRVIIRKQYDSQWPMCLGECDHIMSMITINRVQDVYANPVYTTTGGDANDLALPTLDELDQLMHQTPPLHLDDDQYHSKRSTFTSCHIGDYFI